MRGFFHTFVCVFFSYICMRVFLIHLYAILYACFFHTFVCVVFFIHLYACFLSYIWMRVFVIHLYACLFHTFLHFDFGWPWRSGECGRPITRGLAVQSPPTAQQKNYQCITHSHYSSPETFLLACFFHTFACGFFSYICMRVFFIHLYVFLSYICMRVFLVHLYAGFCHTFVCDFVCVFLAYICMRVCMFFSYICMRVFFIHFYISIWVGRVTVVSVVVQ